MLIISVNLSIQRMFYFTFQIIHFFLQKRCSDSFPIYVKWNNYCVNFIVQPLQAIYILTIVKFFTPIKSANKDDSTIEDADSETIQSGFEISSMANNDLKGTLIDESGK